MIIGVPRERKTLEKRVGLTPDGAGELTKNGHKVLIETGAGLGSYYDDIAYKNVGCEVVSTLKEVWTRAEMIVKVKEPHESEYEFFRPGLIIFDYLHLASMPELAAEMTKKKVSGLAYELVRDSNGHFPLLDPMSEVAGKLSIVVGSYFLLSQNAGRGVLMGRTTGVPAPKVVIVGAGIAGKAACDTAVGMGANVTVLDINLERLEQLRGQYGNRLQTVFSTESSLERECVQADLLVGAVLVPGAAAPKIIKRSLIKQMKKGAVFVDISIDQGGCSETSKTTSLENPIYMEEGVIHYGVPNMPAQTPITSTAMLTSATVRYVHKLANMGLREAMEKSPELRNSLNTYNGMLTNQAVSDAVKLPYTPIEQALSK